MGQSPTGSSSPTTRNSRPAGTGGVLEDTRSIGCDGRCGRRPGRRPVPRPGRRPVRRPGPVSRLAAYGLYDFGESGFATTIIAVLYSQYYAGAVAGGAVGVAIGSLRVPGATLYSWIVSLSMLLIAVTAPILGALADRRASRLVALAAACIPGAGFTVALSTVGPGDWIRGGVLFVAAYTCFAAAAIFYNALLPEVAPRVSIGRASGIAWGMGYLGGGLLLLLNLLMLQKPEALGFPEGTFSIQDCFASAGWWWLAFTIPLLWVFRYEPAERARSRAGAAAAPWGHEIRDALRQVRRTLGELLRTVNLRRFFIAYLLYNDGVQTVVAMASIFGAQELGMQPDQLILLFLLIQGTAFCGSMMMGWLADRAGHKQVLLVSIAAWTFVTIWAAVVGIFGSAVKEYWVLSGIAGLFLGGIQSCSRSMTTHWIPASRESEFFGFFAIMTRVASIFGPLVFGALVLATGSLRRAVLAVILFFVAGGIVLMRVRPEEVEGERMRLADPGTGISGP